MWFKGKRFTQIFLYFFNQGSMGVLRNGKILFFRKDIDDGRKLGRTGKRNAFILFSVEDGAGGEIHFYLLQFLSPCFKIFTARKDLMSIMMGSETLCSRRIMEI